MPTKGVMWLRWTQHTQTQPQAHTHTHAQTHKHTYKHKHTRTHKHRQAHTRTHSLSTHSHTQLNWAQIGLSRADMTMKIKCLQRGHVPRAAHNHLREIVNCARIARCAAVDLKWNSLNKTPRNRSTTAAIPFCGSLMRNWLPPLPLLSGCFVINELCAVPEEANDCKCVNGGSFNWWLRVLRWACGVRARVYANAYPPHSACGILIALQLIPSLHVVIDTLHAHQITNQIELTVVN